MAALRGWTEEICTAVESWSVLKGLALAKTVKKLGLGLRKIGSV